MNILNRLIEMRSNNRSGNRSKRVRCLPLWGLLLCAIAGNVAAQTDGAYIIYRQDGATVHYLAHVYNSTSGDYDLQDATSFSPDCIWYSGSSFNPAGTNHNYYFYDGVNYRFLSAPFSGSGAIYLSASLPSTSLLRNTDQDYYFYEWDWTGDEAGIARGHQYNVVEAQCGGTYNDGDWGADDGECWEVYWLEYNNNGWELSSTHQYGHTGNWAKFSSITITEHAEEVQSVTSGDLATIADFEMTWNPGTPNSESLTMTASNYTYNYIPAYTTYTFRGEDHYYYGGTDHASIPTQTTATGCTPQSYTWTIEGEGAEFLSFSSSSDVKTVTSTSSANATLYYITENDLGHKEATLTLTVTYADGSNLGHTTTQVRTATVTVLTPCKNPGKVSDPVVTYEDVTVTWYNTADKYKVEWQTSGGDWSSASSAIVEDATSYTITGLEYGTTYDYRVTAYCEGWVTPAGSTISFTTPATPGLLIYGAVYGGGRMANVGGKTEVIIVNCDSISGVYGGNDIAGEVEGTDGSTITLGVSTDGGYGTTSSSTGVTIGSVYGGGNGFYGYGGNLKQASYNTVYTMVPDASVTRPGDATSTSLWTNESGVNVTLNCPKIKKTAITVNTDYVKIDSLFGGARNAILSLGSATDVNITVNGGTVYALFGGNNYGGSLGYLAEEHITVNNTKTSTTIGDWTNTATTGLGRDFGIRYLFGGGNRVQGQHVYVSVVGGQIDTLFGGGNSADVRSTSVTVNCELAANPSGGVCGNAYSNAITSYTAGTPPTVGISEGYAWNGTGIYNVRTLFGGNNAASMEGIPTVTLTSGGVGTVYGGGNAGDMLAQETDDCTNEHNALEINDNAVKYGTHVVLNSPKMVVDYLYGGCQMSNVDYSTWVEIKDGNVGTVYGGCNISGDVGSTRVNPSLAESKSLAYQAVQGATYVMISGGTVYKNVFAGSNGYYHCNDNIKYITKCAYIDAQDPHNYYLGLAVPTHNETHVVISNGTIKNNVYAGGNLACVGFNNYTVGDKPFPKLVGLASVRMSAGTVEGAVYGGGNMASVYGSNEVQVSGGTIGKLYGGNDQTGAIAEMSNRVLPSSYNHASDQHTSLEYVDTYVGITGAPHIGTVFGGGNGAYDYESGHYCDATDKPIQSNTFVDIGITGGVGGGEIGTVYGGGDGVHVKTSVTVLLNSVKPENVAAYDNVGTIFGGNNVGNMEFLVPEIILLSGQVGTVYGGCNQGEMTFEKTITDKDGNSYENVGSYVTLRDNYIASDGETLSCSNAIVSNAVYGGCRMNNVTYKSLVLVEGGIHTDALIFGGCDISGNTGESRVVVNGGTAGSVFGGGNGDYADSEYESGGAYAGLSKPGSTASYVDMMDGTCAKIYGGGNAAGVTTSTVTMTGGTVTTGIYGGCNSSGAITGDVTLNINAGTVGSSSTVLPYTGATIKTGIFGGGFGQNTSTGSDVTVNIGPAAAGTGPTIYADIYGGSAQGTVNASTSTTTVNINNASVYGNVYGGGLGTATLDANGYREAEGIKAYVNGDVLVNIGNVSSGNGPTFSNTSKVFGCNNLAGTPKGTVEVHVYKTAHTSGSSGNSVPDPIPSTADGLLTPAPTASNFAIQEVYGGGNLSPYDPTVSTLAPLVHIHNCDNTIRYVYGGGNAAEVPATDVYIEGGRMEYVFAGGNGYGYGNPGADVNGDASVMIEGGLISYLFGGSNTLGYISGASHINYKEVNPGCPRLIAEVYGGGNEAPSGDIVMTIPCGAKAVKQFFGGAKNADVGTSIEPHSVTLNVYGGEFEELFGGNNVGGTIWGDVTLNIYGGKIASAYGGNNQGGIIKGNIIVNVIMDTAVCPSQMQLVNVFGGGKDAKYGCKDDCATALGETATTHAGYPQVNIIRGCVEENVFGGGLGETAIVYGSPHVTVGGSTTVVPAYDVTVGETTTTYLPSAVPNPLPTGAVVTPTTTTPDPSPKTYWPKVGKGTSGAVEGAVYGGGSEAKVEGSTDVKIIKNAVINGNVYGGGLGPTAIITGSTNVKIGE